MAVEWIDELPAPRGQGRKSSWGPIVEELRTQPGQWALIATGLKRSNAWNKSVSLKRYGAEVAVRHDDDGGFALYGRWPLEEPA